MSLNRYDIVWARLPGYERERIVRVRKINKRAKTAVVQTDVHGMQRKTYTIPLSAISKVISRWSERNVSIEKEGAA
jgi:hypothetical protein